VTGTYYTSNQKGPVFDPTRLHKLYTIPKIRMS
jgi:hypothetical protein